MSAGGLLYPYSAIFSKDHRQNIVYTLIQDQIRRGIIMSNQTAIPFIQMRGGSSKGIYFHRTDLPNDSDQRNAVLKWVMGAHGDARQIDGLGGILGYYALISMTIKTFDIDPIIVDEAEH